VYDGVVFYVIFFVRKDNKSLFRCILAIHHGSEWSTTARASGSLIVFSLVCQQLPAANLADDMSAIGHFHRVDSQLLGAEDAVGIFFDLAVQLGELLLQEVVTGRGRRRRISRAMIGCSDNLVQELFILLENLLQAEQLISELTASTAWHYGSHHRVYSGMLLFRFLLRLGPAHRHCARHVLFFYVFLVFAL
jgi:hypothetical protein